MDDETRIKILKLAMAYHTGWEYRSGGQEAGSVIADVFWQMQKKNRERFLRIWDKHEMEFLQVVPPPVPVYPSQKTEIAVRAAKGRDGKKLSQGTCFYTVTEDGSLAEFETEKEITLNTARLQYALYEKYGHAWLVYDRDRDGGDWEETGLLLFAECGQEMPRPSVSWKLNNIGNGLAYCSWQVSEAWLDGKDFSAWSISDGSNTYPLNLSEKEDTVWLEGSTPAFAENLQATGYEVYLETVRPRWFPERVQQVLTTGLTLEEQAYRSAPELIITEDLVCTENEFLPFGQQIDEFSCCYMGWNRVLARPCTALTLEYEESCRLEEKLPEKKSPAYEKAVRKYPWLRQDETVHNWKAEETIWEYFDGEMWRVLEGSAGWQTCCGTETVLKTFTFTPPSDMAGAAVEGETLFYLRLRIVKTKQPYALYYRKYIPVLKNIRLERAAYTWEGASSGGRACRKEIDGAEERMYFGFEQPLHAQSGIRIETETDSGGKAAGSYTAIPSEWILGTEDRWEKEAYWLKWERMPEESKEQKEQKEESLKLLSWNFNCVPVREKEGREIKAGSAKLRAGTEFSGGQDTEAGLQAEALSDAYLPHSAGVSEDTAERAQNLLRSFGRMVTIEDIRRRCRERYPRLTVTDCRMDRSRQPVLTVVLQEREDFPGWSRALECEVREWLEGVLSLYGSLWLADCRVKIELLPQSAGKPAGETEPRP